MLGEFNNMKNEINLLTGEIINKGDLHEQLIVKLPLNSKVERFKEDLKNSNLSDEEKKPHEQLLEEVENCKYAIYNMRGYGYQFGGVNARGDGGSFYHHLLRSSIDIDKEALGYIIKASVYTLFSHSSPKLSIALKGQRDLSLHDKEILDEYVESQTKYYSKYCDEFDLDYFIEDCEEPNKVLYETFFCKVMLKDYRLIVELNCKEKELPRSLLWFIDLNNHNGINGNLLELIIRYELYLEYGVHIPSGIYDNWYTEESYINSHLLLGDEIPSYDCQGRIVSAKNNDNGVFKDIDESNFRKNLGHIVEQIYKDKPKDMIETYKNYWLLYINDFKRTFFNIVKPSSLSGSSFFS